MIERTKTLIFVDSKSIFKELGKDLIETLRKESIRNTREGFTNHNPYMWMENESSFLKPKRID